MGTDVDIAGAAEAALGHSIPIPGIQRLRGGYSWQTYLVSDGAAPQVVVRVAPNGGTLDPYDPDAERRALEAAGGSVPAPRVLLVEADPSVYGASLQVQTVGPGVGVRASSVGSRLERHAYRSALAVALGTLHREGDASRLGSVATTGEALRRVIESEVEHYRRAAPGRHPGFEIGLRWLLSNIPDGDGPAVVCHGDYRFNNVLWTGPGEIGAVLDWERAWAGDPMCDVAFTRHFSGWAAVDGDVVPLYEAASGRKVPESRMTFYLRLERWRSYTASMRGMAAASSGRSDAPDLVLIGEAGVSGMWDLVNWMEEGLAPLPDDLATRPAGFVESISASRRAEIGRTLEPDDRRRPHLVSGVEVADALERSVALLRSVSDMPRLQQALGEADPERAWNAAYEVLTTAAAEGGRRLHPALQALGYRFTAGPTFLPEMKWR